MNLFWSDHGSSFLNTWLLTVMRLSTGMTRNAGASPRVLDAFQISYTASETIQNINTVPRHGAWMRGTVS